MQGGSFLAGFASAGTVQAFGNLGGFEFLERNGIIDASPEGFGEYFANAATASIIGGTASVIGGGKFANGALTGAFSRLFNDVRIVIKRRMPGNVFNHIEMGFDDKRTRGFYPLGFLGRRGLFDLFRGVNGVMRYGEREVLNELVLQTSSSADNDMRWFLDHLEQSPAVIYVLDSRNCVDLVIETLRTGGVFLPTVLGINAIPGNQPGELMDFLRQNAQ
ncbi:MAG: hypothetical protein IT495_15180 [Gammaproteobacteria bacterium]|nr:hypothetical protein [Gammaproteobacteria bacterium]